MAPIPGPARRLQSCNWVSGRLRLAWTLLKAERRSARRCQLTQSSRWVLFEPNSLVRDCFACSLRFAASIAEPPASEFRQYRAMGKILAAPVLLFEIGQQCCSSSSDRQRSAVSSSQLLSHRHELNRWPTPTFFDQTPHSRFGLHPGRKCLLRFPQFSRPLSHSSLTLRCCLTLPLPSWLKAATGRHQQAISGAEHWPIVQTQSLQSSG